jgi:hypothetical protein
LVERDPRTKRALLSTLFHRMWAFLTMTSCRPTLFHFDNYPCSRQGCQRQVHQHGSNFFNCARRQRNHSDMVASWPIAQIHAIPQYTPSLQHSYYRFVIIHYVKNHVVLPVVFMAEGRNS